MSYTSIQQPIIQQAIKRAVEIINDLLSQEDNDEIYYIEDVIEQTCFVYSSMVGLHEPLKFEFHLSDLVLDLIRKSVTESVKLIDNKFVVQ